MKNKAIFILISLLIVLLALGWWVRLKNVDSQTKLPILKNSSTQNSTHLAQKSSQKQASETSQASSEKSSSPSSSNKETKESDISSTLSKDELKTFNKDAVEQEYYIKSPLTPNGTFEKATLKALESMEKKYTLTKITLLRDNNDGKLKRVVIFE
ncbi:hypothetical protein [Lactococcus lactis]|uniref:Cytoskeletal protein RodZ n=1 Tax=Lactococcus lactis TaxID=1358 RepID=A0AAW5TQC5_9LACT|nr:hypothetical protein [Lactococcus lactis]MCW2280948.1 cytoskeletal protein RodZ [Lactococcus lactis]